MSNIKTGNMKMVNGRLFEQIIFKSGVSGWYFSDLAHKVYNYCDFNGLDSNNFTTFETVYARFVIN
jgi:hypothetical protein